MLNSAGADMNAASANIVGQGAASFWNQQPNVQQMQAMLQPPGALTNNFNNIGMSALPNEQQLQFQLDNNGVNLQ